MDDHLAKIARLLGPAMKAGSWKRKGRTWWLTSAETVCVLNLQMARFSPRFYANLGVMIRKLDAQPTPHISACHLQARMGDVMQNHLAESALFDFSNAKYRTGEGYREAVEAIEIYAIPLLTQCATLQGLRDAIEANPRLGLWTWRNALDFLGLDYETIAARVEAASGASNGI